MSESARLCPHCHAGTPREDARCWLCETELPTFDERLLASAVAPAPLPAGVSSREAERKPPRRTETDLGLWALASLVSTALMIVIAIEVAGVDAGMALAASATCLPVVVTLGTMLWTRRPSSNPARVQVGTTSLSRRLVLVVLALLALTILTLFVALCAVAFSELYPARVAEPILG